MPKRKTLATSGHSEHQSLEQVEQIQVVVLEMFGQNMWPQFIKPSMCFHFWAAQQQQQRVRHQSWYIFYFCFGRIPFRGLCDMLHLSLSLSHFNTHTTTLSLYLPLTLPLSLHIYLPLTISPSLSTYLSLFTLSIYLTLTLSLSLSTSHSIYLPLTLSPSLYLSFTLSHTLSIYHTHLSHQVYFYQLSVFLGQRYLPKHSM